jgi:hypothetical protein
MLVELARVAGEHRAAGQHLSMDGDSLLLVDVVNAHGVVILQTVWAPADNVRFGRRVTRVENIQDQAQLLDRLIALVPLIAGELPLRAPDPGLGDNVVLVNLAAPEPAAETTGPPIRKVPKAAAA